MKRRGSGVFPFILALLTLVMFALCFVTGFSGVVSIVDIYRAFIAQGFSPVGAALAIGGCILIPCVVFFILVRKYFKNKTGRT